MEGLFFTPAAQAVWDRAIVALGPRRIEVPIEVLSEAARSAGFTVTEGTDDLLPTATSAVLKVPAVFFEKSGVRIAVPRPVVIQGIARLSADGATAKLAWEPVGRVEEVGSLSSRSRVHARLNEVIIKASGAGAPEEPLSEALRQLPIPPWILLRRLTGDGVWTTDQPAGVTVEAAARVMTEEEANAAWAEFGRSPLGRAV